MNAHPFFHRGQVLFNEINNFISGIVPLDTFPSLLKQFKPLLLTPLQIEAPDQASRQEVSSRTVVLEGRPHVLTDEFVQKTFKLSELLGLNERRCVELLKYALQMGKRYVEWNEFQIAVYTFFEDRRLLLMGLLRLLTSRTSEDLNPAIREQIFHFTNELIFSDLAKQLISALKSDLDNITESREKEIGLYKFAERSHILHCLFYIYYQTTASKDQAKAMLELFERTTSSKTLLRKINEEQFFQLSYLILLCLYCILDINHQLIIARTGEAVQNELLVNPEFIKEFGDTLKGTEDRILASREHISTGFFHSLRLQWILFYYASQKRLDEKELEIICSGGVFTFMASIVSNSHFQRNVEHYDAFIGVFHDILDSFLRCDDFWTKKTDAPYFPSIFEFISVIYKNEPSFAINFWPTKSRPIFHFHQFLRILGERMNIDCRFYIPYLNMITSLACNEECAYQAYLFLKKPPHKFISWDFFFEGIHKYFLTFQSQTQYQAFEEASSDEKLLPDDINRLMAILKLIKQIFSQSNPNTVERIIENTNLPIETLFYFLICKLESQLKAQLFQTLSSLGKSSDSAAKIWNLLEKYDVLQGIKAELQNGQFDTVIGFLSLIDQLLNFAVPIPLLQTRFIGYIKFIIGDVFYPFHQRQILDSPLEKWKLACHCLRIFFKILENYDVNQSSSNYEGSHQRAFQLAGFQFIQSFLNYNGPAETVFIILKEAAENLEKEKFQENGEYFEESVLLSLKLLECILKKEIGFTKNLNTSVISMETLFDKYSEKNTNQFLNISKLIPYQNDSEISLYAIKIFQKLSPHSKKRATDVFRDDENRLFLIQAFVEKLEAEEPHINYLEDSQNSIRLQIIQFLIQNLDSSPPNLTHMVLAFNKDDVPSSDLERSVVTCLHVVVELLNSPVFLRQNPVLAENCFELIYRLCSNKYTGLPVLHFLHNRNFFVQQLAFLEPIELDDQDPYLLFNLYYQVWLLKSIALNIHATPSTDYRHQILNLLFHEIREELELEEEELIQGNVEQPRMKILELLDAFNFPLPEVTLPKTSFNINLASFSYIGKRKVPFINIKALSQRLNQERRLTEQTTGFGAQTIQKEEVKELLEYAQKKNFYNGLFAAQCGVFEAWKQVVEVTLYHSYDYLRQIGKEPLLYDLLEILLQKQNAENTEPHLAIHISEAVLVLITKLREQKHSVANSLDVLTYGLDLPINQLHIILEGIITGIIKNKHPEMKGNLYAALLNYLAFTKKEPIFIHPKLQEEIYWRVKEIDDQQNKLEEGNFAILGTPGDKLFQVISEDISNPNSVWKALALSTLDVLLKYDISLKILHFFQTSGFLIFILESLKQEGETLSKILASSNPEEFGLLFIYESKMSLLLHIAQSERGAEKLLEINCLAKLSELKIFNNRPEDMIDYDDQTSLLPSAIERYYQLLLPMLRLLLVLLTTRKEIEKPIQGESRTAREVADFIEINADAFSTILKDRSIQSISSLKALELITGIFYHLSYYSVVFDKLQNGKFHPLLLNLIHKYFDYHQFQHLIRQLLHGQQNREKLESEFQLTGRNICRNLISYCRVLMDRQIQISTLFTHSIISKSTELQTRETDEDEIFPSVPRSHQKLPPLSLLIGFLRNSLSLYRSTKRDQEKYIDDLQNTSDLLPEVLLQYESYIRKTALSKLSPEQQLHFVQSKLVQLLEIKNQELDCLFYIIENSLYVLWKHLHSFLHSSLPKTEKDQIKKDALSILGQNLIGQSESILIILTNLDDQLQKSNHKKIVGSIVKNLKQLLK